MRFRKRRIKQNCSKHVENQMGYRNFQRDAIFHKTLGFRDNGLTNCKSRPIALFLPDILEFIFYKRKCIVKFYNFFITNISRQNEFLAHDITSYPAYIKVFQICMCNSNNSWYWQLSIPGIIIVSCVTNLFVINILYKNLKRMMLITKLAHKIQKR